MSAGDSTTCGMRGHESNKRPAGPHRVVGFREAALQQVQQQLEELLAVLLDGVVDLQARREGGRVSAAARPGVQLREQPPVSKASSLADRDCCEFMLEQTRYKLYAHVKHRTSPCEVADPVRWAKCRAVDLTRCRHSGLHACT